MMMLLMCGKILECGVISWSIFVPSFASFPSRITLNNRRRSQEEEEEEEEGISNNLKRKNETSRFVVFFILLLVEIIFC